MIRNTLIAIALLFAACEAPQKPDTPPKTAVKEPVTGTRIIAVGDVHGDVDALRGLLRRSNLIDENDRWSGGSTVLVQTGDILDRGVTERQAYDLLLGLRKEAAAVGGKVILLSGNHEIMNVAGDLRYVVPEAMDDFDASTERVAMMRQDLPEPLRLRLAAWGPGGPYAKALSRDGVIAVVDDTIFVHGGLSPKYAGEIERLNAAVRVWMQGSGPPPEAVIVDQEGPVWTRQYSKDPADCAALDDVLKRVGAKRMVVGHTPQRSGISSACDDRVWRIDTGMSRHYGGEPQALEIIGTQTRTLP